MEYVDYVLRRGILMDEGYDTYEEAKKQRDKIENRKKNFIQRYWDKAFGPVTIQKRILIDM